VIRRITSNTSTNTPLRIWLLAGVTSLALAGAMVTLTTRTVFADATLSRPAATASVQTPVASATPASLAPQENADQQRADRLHGLASWYGTVFNGRLTASGERFNMYAMTACHRTLPFGSLVRVVNRDNKKSVVVKITDRGDLFEGRIIDLSFAAAQKISMTKAGLANVDVQVISLGHPRNTN